MPKILRTLKWPESYEIGNLVINGRFLDSTVMVQLDSVVVVAASGPWLEGEAAVGRRLDHNQDSLSWVAPSHRQSKSFCL